MPPGNPLTFEAVCTLVGRLYLESQHAIQQSSQVIAELSSRLAAAERERDEARSKDVTDGPAQA